jgi:probable phosphoglycerate mutase
VDGSSRGNPGSAGIGVAIFSEGQDEPVAEISRNIGITTNNVAEYEAMIAALRWLVDQKAETAVIKLDSELVFKQLNAEYRIKTKHILPLVQRIRGLLNLLPSVEVVLIPREENKIADRLAQKASKTDKKVPVTKIKFTQGKLS